MKQNCGVRKGMAAGCWAISSFECCGGEACGGLRIAQNRPATLDAVNVALWSEWISSNSYRSKLKVADRHDDRYLYRDSRVVAALAVMSRCPVGAEVPKRQQLIDIFQKRETRSIVSTFSRLPRHLSSLAIFSCSISFDVPFDQESSL